MLKKGRLFKRLGGGGAKAKGFGDQQAKGVDRKRKLHQTLLLATGEGGRERGRMSEEIGFLSNPPPRPTRLPTPEG